MIYKLRLNKVQYDVVKDAAQEYIDLRNNKWENFIKDVMDNVADNPPVHNNYIVHCEDISIEEAVKMFQIVYHIAHPTPNSDVLENVLTKFNIIREEDGVILEGEAKLFKGLNIVLEEYFRIRMGQWFDFADNFCLNGFIYNTEDPNNKEKFDDFICRRNECCKLLVIYYHYIDPGYSRKSEKQCIAEDIWQVIRYRQWNDRPEEYKKANFWSVEGHKPLKTSMEEFPVWV